jgi:hypothetical protein
MAKNTVTIAWEGVLRLQAIGDIEPPKVQRHPALIGLPANVIYSPGVAPIPAELLLDPMQTATLLGWLLQLCDDGKIPPLPVPRLTPLQRQ